MDADATFMKKPKTKAVKRRLWLCSVPYLSGIDKPSTDESAHRVTARRGITAAVAAEIAVETSEVGSEGDEYFMWVWLPGGVAKAKEYVVSVSCVWKFKAKHSPAY